MSEKLSERTIDALIKWIERCLFHDEGYNAPTQRDLHVWLKHAKKFKREQDNLKADIVQLREDCAPFQAQIDQLKSYEVRCNYCKRTPAEAKGGYKCSTCKQGGDDETKNEIPPKVGREDVEHPHPQL